MKKAKKYLSRDHIVVRLSKDGIVKKDYTGVTIGWISIDKHLGFNFRGKSVYECHDIFGNKFNCSASRFAQKWFAYKVWHRESILMLRKLRQCYSNMIKRCYSPDSLTSKYYYAKGVTVAPVWLGTSGFKNFVEWAALSGYKLGLTIDKDSMYYSPESCTWVTRSYNCRHTSRTKFNEKLVVQVRNDYKKFKGLDKDFCNKWALQINCTPSGVREVIKNKRWKNIEI